VPHLVPALPPRRDRARELTDAPPRSDRGRETWHHALVAPPDSPVPDAEVQAALQVIFQGTASETGERFFMALVENLARALGTRGAWVAEIMPAQRRLRALAFWLGGEWVQNYE